MTAFFVIVAILVGHSGRNFLHAEEGFVEISHTKVVIRMDGHMSDLCKHGVCLLVGWILFKVTAFCQQLPVRFRVNPHLSRVLKTQRKLDF